MNRAAARAIIAGDRSAREDDEYEKKPVPPDDLWQKLDEAIKELKPAKPANSFTAKELAYYLGGVGKHKLQNIIKGLRQAGKIELHGRGNATYYVFKDSK